MELGKCQHSDGKWTLMPTFLTGTKDLHEGLSHAFPHFYDKRHAATFRPAERKPQGYLYKSEFHTGNARLLKALKDTGLFRQVKPLHFDVA